MLVDKAGAVQHQARDIYAQSVEIRGSYQLRPPSYPHFSGVKRVILTVFDRKMTKMKRDLKSRFCTKFQL